MRLFWFETTGGATMDDMNVLDWLGHNSRAATLRVEVRLFNSLTRHGSALPPDRQVELPVAATVGELVKRLGLPEKDVFLVLVNGRDVSPGCYRGGAINRAHSLREGDVVAFSGPVPYSFGYGAPVV